jgi:hypothetical protein
VDDRLGGTQNGHDPQNRVLLTSRQEFVMSVLYKVIGFGDNEHGFFNEKSVSSNINFAYGFYQAHVADANCTGAVIIKQDHESWQIVESFGIEGMSITCGNFMSFSVSKAPKLVMV